MNNSPPLIHTAGARTKAKSGIMAQAESWPRQFLDLFMNLGIQLFMTYTIRAHLTKHMPNQTHVGQGSCNQILDSLSLRAIGDK